MSLALENIRVLDLSQGAVGPYCAMMLGDMGAEVIKVEPLEGDWARNLGPPFLGGENVLFLSINRNKKSVAIDITKKKGRDIVLKLSERSDVFLENFRPGVIDKLGLGYEILREANQQIVFCSISAFGQDGPLRNNPGLDLILQGASGIMSVTGEENRPPSRVGTPIADMVAGMFGFQGVVLALFVRERLGFGQKVEVAMLDSLISLQSPMIHLYFATGKNPKRMGNAFPSIVPAQSFLTKDNKYINLSVPADKFWPRLCKAINRKELEKDSRFDSISKRVEHRKELIPILEDIFSQKTAAEWLKTLRNEDVICGPVNDYVALLQEPQVLKNEIFSTIDHPTIGSMKTTGIPIRLKTTPGSIQSPPPLLGQHTEEILGKLGYKTKEIDRLRKEKTI